MKKDFTNVTDEELVLYAQQHKEASDEIEEIVERFKNMVHYVVRQQDVTPASQYYQDCVQNGYVILLKSIDRFDGSIPFKNYLYECLHKRLIAEKRCFRHAGIMLSEGQLYRLATIKQCYHDFFETHKRYPTLKEWHHHYRQMFPNVKITDWISKLFNFNLISGDATKDSNNHNLTETLLSLMPDENEDIEAPLTQEINYEFLMTPLSDREKRIVMDAMNEKTFKEIADDLGLSMQRIHAIYQKSIAKIKQFVSDRGIDATNFREFL